MKQILIAIVLLLSVQLSAQEIQWASEVVSVSSQYERDSYSAKQVLGPPNKYPAWGKSELAWAPNGESVGKQYIRVRFKTPINVRQVVVAETLNPGAIAQIYLYDLQGKGHKVYENNMGQSTFGDARLFGQKIAQTPYKVSQLKLVLNTDMIKGMQQIDAIGISGSTRKPDVKVNDKSYGEGVLPPERLSYNVNSRYAERLPIISPDGQTLYYARKWHPDNIGKNDEDDIWISQRLPNGDWSKSVNPGPPMNNATHNFVVAVSPDGQTLYLANDYNSNKKDGVSVSKFKNGKWTSPKALRIINHYNRNKFVCYHVSVDGNVMLMTVERDDGLGDRDICVSFRYSDGDWSEPKSIGSTINTSGMEASVFLAADMKTIYFSSDGHNGHGGLDVFMSRRKDFTWTSWTEPVNLGPVINTKGNDLNYSIPASGEYAYFSSDIDSPDLMSNLYRIRLPEEVRPEPVTVFKGRFIDAETNEPIVASVEVNPREEQKEKRQEQEIRQENPKEVKKVPSREVEVDEEDDKFQVVLQSGSNYEVLPKVDGYFPVSENIDMGAIVMEELDYDGNDPEIIKQIEKEKSKPDAMTSYEVDELQKQLVNLETELEEAERKRDEARDRVNDVNNTDYFYEPYVYKPTYQELEKPAKRAPVTLNEDETPFGSVEDVPWRPETRQNQVDDDPELTELERRYMTLYSEPEVETPPRRAPEVNEPEPTYAQQEPRKAPRTEQPQKEQPQTKESSGYTVGDDPYEQETAYQDPQQKEIESEAPRETKPNPVDNDPKVTTLEDKYAALFDEEEDDTSAPQTTPEKVEKRPVSRKEKKKKNNKELVDFNDPVDNTTTTADSETPEKGKRSPRDKKAEQNTSSLEDKYAALFDDEDRDTNYQPGDTKATGGDYEPGQAPTAQGGGYQPGKAPKATGGGYQPGKAPKATGGSYQPGQAPTASGGVGRNEPSEKEQQVVITKSWEKDSPPAPSFEELKDQVRRDIENELKGEVKQELQEELLADVKSELEKELESDIRDQLKDDLKKDVEDQLKLDMQKDIEDQLRTDLKSGVEDKLRDDLKGDVADELRDKMRDDIENELRDKLEDDIEKQLRDEMKDAVREELKKELEYRYKKELEQKLRRELEQKLRKQMLERQRDIELASGGKPSTSSDGDGGNYRELQKDIMMYPIKVGQIIPLNNIYFEANKSTLKEESTNELVRVFEFLDSNPNLIVEIRGHTNGLCSDAFADELSTDRSNSVMKYITERGIPRDRIEYKGYGKTEPVASNDSVEGRKKNQRVEMKILEIK